MEEIVLYADCATLSMVKEMNENVLIGASLSEPHTDEFAVEFVYIIIYFSYVVP